MLSRRFEGHHRRLEHMRDEALQRPSALRGRSHLFRHGVVSQKDLESAKEGAHAAEAIAREEVAARGTQVDVRRTGELGHDPHGPDIGRLVSEGWRQVGGGGRLGGGRRQGRDDDPRPLGFVLR